MDYNIGHIVEQRYIDHINDKWQRFNDKVSDLFFPYDEDRTILRFPTVKELIPLLDENDTINFCRLSPEYSFGGEYEIYYIPLFKNEVKVKDLDPNVLEFIENRLVKALKTTLADDGLTLRHMVQLQYITEYIKEIKTCD